MEKLYYNFDENENILNKMVELINALDNVDNQLYNEVAGLTQVWESDSSAAFYVSLMNTEDTYQKALQSFIEHLQGYFTADSYYKEAKNMVDEGIMRKLGGI